MNVIKTPTGLVPVDEIGRVMTQAQYDALSAEEKKDGTFYITDDNGKSVMDIIGNRDISNIGKTVKDAIYIIDNKLEDISDIIKSNQIKSLLGYTVSGDDIYESNGNLILKNERGVYIKDTAGVLNRMIGVDSSNNVYVAQGEASNHTIIMGNSKTKKTVLNGDVYIGDKPIQNSMNINGVSLMDYLGATRLYIQSNQNLGTGSSDVSINNVSKTTINDLITVRSSTDIVFNYDGVYEITVNLVGQGMTDGDCLSSRIVKNAGSSRTYLTINNCKAASDGYAGVCYSTVANMAKTNYININAYSSAARGSLHKDYSIITIKKVG